MKITYRGDRTSGNYPQFIDIGHVPIKTLGECVPGETYDVVPASSHPSPLPGDGLWEGADEEAQRILDALLHPGQATLDVAPEPGDGDPEPEAEPAGEPAEQAAVPAPDQVPVTPTIPDRSV